MSLRSISLTALCLFAGIAQVNAESPEDAVTPTQTAADASYTPIPMYEAGKYCHWQVEGAHPIICPTDHQSRSLSAEELVELYEEEAESYRESGEFEDLEEEAIKPKSNRTRKHAKGKHLRPHRLNSTRKGSGRHRSNGTRHRGPFKHRKHNGTRFHYPGKNVKHNRTRHNGPPRQHRKNNATLTRPHFILPRDEEKQNGTRHSNPLHRLNGTRHHSNPMHKFNGTRHHRNGTKVSGVAGLQGLDKKPALEFENLGMKGKVPGAEGPKIAARDVDEVEYEDYEDEIEE